MAKKDAKDKAATESEGTAIEKSDPSMPWLATGDKTDLGYSGTEYADDKNLVKIDKIPTLHLCQPNSPEVNDTEVAKAGEFVARLGGKLDTTNPRFGAKIKMVILARGVEFIWWPNKNEEGGGGAPVARMVKGATLPEGMDGNDLLWPNDGGNVRDDGKDRPVADETQSFIVAVWDDKAGKFLEAPLAIGFSGGSFKAGEQLQTLLNMFRGPHYGAVIEVTTVKTKDAKSNSIYYVPEFKGAGAIPVSPLLERFKAHHDATQPFLTLA